MQVLAKRLEGLAVSEEAEKALDMSGSNGISPNGGGEKGWHKDEGHETDALRDERQEHVPERKTPAIPRTIPLTPNYLARTQSAGASPATRTQTPGSPNSASFAIPGRTSSSPVRPTMTGTRYGSALAGQNTGNGSPWASRAMPGTSTPLCARCTKPVYFAEQVKANGRVFHKPCLRCTDCNTALDSSRLAEKGEQVVCRSCYSKVSLSCVTI